LQACEKRTRFATMRHRDIILRLGGLTATALAVGRDQSRVTRWRQTGIPLSAWNEVIDAARLAGFDLTVAMLAEGSPRLRRNPPETSLGGRV